MQPNLCLRATAAQREKLKSRVFLLQKLQTLNLEALEKLIVIFPDLNKSIYVESASLQFVQFLDLKMIQFVQFLEDLKIIWKLSVRAHQPTFPCPVLRLCDRN